MEPWGARLYGDPCTRCAWSWSGDAAADIAYVREVPARYARLLTGRAGTERHPDLGWSVTGYVCHVGDNLRQWAERVAGVLRGGDPRVAGYDPDALAAARGYERTSLPAALWSLERSAAAWVQVLGEAVAAGVVLQHATRGPQPAADVAGNNAHDAHHHEWDVRRSLAASAAPPEV
ncbi:DinB family protein [Kineococcus glutinatus]|uniref:DinB-like domain-containing protein n=1 Tax=Kineococcus glutinatus TaxID=1070872 RepID=A0ABP9H575_9ACTN